MKDISAERIVITGATNGIGKEIARELSLQGAHLTLVARNQKKAAATAKELGGDIDIVLCDLADLSSIRTAAQELNERYDEIDVLVANAGIQTYKGATTVDGFEEMMGTNHLGPFLLTNLLLEPLKKAKPSRIVVTASEAHRGGGRADIATLGAPADFGLAKASGYYSRSKLMNILFTQELAERLDGTGVTVNCFCPGAVDTGLVRDNALLKRASSLASRTPLIRTPAQGARMGVRLVRDPSLDRVSGKFFTSTPGARFLPTMPVLKDRDYRRQVWEKSAELVNL